MRNKDDDTLDIIEYIIPMLSRDAVFHIVEVVLTDLYLLLDTELDLLQIVGMNHALKRIARHGLERFQRFAAEYIEMITSDPV